MAAPRGLPAFVRRWRPIATIAVIGAVIGGLLAMAGPPTYRSVASVVAERDRVAHDPVEMRRLAELARGSQVTDAAAALLGDDLPGADLLTQVEVSPAPEGGALEVVATSDSADMARAVADAYADAIPPVLDSGLAPGAAATPASEVGGRSLPLWSLAGLLVGVLAGALLVVTLGAGERAPRDGRFPRLRRPSRARSRRPIVALPSGSLLEAEGQSVAPTGAAGPALEAILAELGSRRGERRPLLVADLERADGAPEVAAAIAVAAAEEGLHVLAVDARFGSEGLAAALGVDPVPGLAEYLRRAAGPSEVLRRVLVRAPTEGSRWMACLPAGGRDAGEGLAGRRFRGLIGRVGGIYDLVVVAGGRLGGDSFAQLVAGAGAVALVGPVGALEPQLGSDREWAPKGAKLHTVIGITRP